MNNTFLKPPVGILPFLIFHHLTQLTQPQVALEEDKVTINMTASTVNLCLTLESKQQQGLVLSSFTE
jgi:hypothetical protein